MNKLLFFVVLAFGLTISTFANAQESIDTVINAEDFAILKNLACTGDASDPQLQSSLGEMESLITQVFTNYGLEITDEQLDSLGAMATDAKLQLEQDEAVIDFCSQ